MIFDLLGYRCFRRKPQEQYITKLSTHTSSYDRLMYQTYLYRNFVWCDHWLIIEKIKTPTKIPISNVKINLLLETLLTGLLNHFYNNRYSLWIIVNVCLISYLFNGDKRMPRFPSVHNNWSNFLLIKITYIYLFVLIRWKNVHEVNLRINFKNVPSHNISNKV